MHCQTRPACPSENVPIHIYPQYLGSDFPYTVRYTYTAPSFHPPLPSIRPFDCLQYDKIHCSRSRSHDAYPRPRPRLRQQRKTARRRVYKTRLERLTPLPPPWNLFFRLFFLFCFHPAWLVLSLPWVCLLLRR